MQVQIFKKDQKLPFPFYEDKILDDPNFNILRITIVHMSHCAAQLQRKIFPIFRPEKHLKQMHSAFSLIHLLLHFHDSSRNIVATAPMITDMHTFRSMRLRFE